MGVAALSGGCDRQSEPPAQPTRSAEGVKPDMAALTGRLDISERGAPIPDAEIALPDGTKRKLTEFSGKPLLINLWATWCGPCVVEMPMLDELAARHVGALKVLTISQDGNKLEKVPEFIADGQFRHLEPWLDPEANLGFAYGTGVLPTTILYDADGKEVWRMIGGHDWTGPRTEAMLADTLAAAAK